MVPFPDPTVVFLLRDTSLYAVGVLLSGLKSRCKDRNHTEEVSIVTSHRLLQCHRPSSPELAGASEIILEVCV